MGGGRKLALLLMIALARAIAPAWAAAREAEPPPEIALDLGAGTTHELMLIRAGTFRQGSPADDPDRGDDEAPRAVMLSRDYYIGKAPVRRGQFARFVAETRYRTEAEKGTSGEHGFDGRGLVQRKEFTWKNPGFTQADDHPVTLVTYDDARAFADWLSRRSRRRVALPTEAQWEYACRAGTTTATAFGVRLSSKQANFDGRSPYNGAENGPYLEETTPVGSYPANAWNIADMHANTWEWCSNKYEKTLSGGIDPHGPTSAASRVVRGGCWSSGGRNCRSASRFGSVPSDRGINPGFRVAQSRPGKESEHV